MTYASYPMVSAFSLLLISSAVLEVRNCHTKSGYISCLKQYYFLILFNVKYTYIQVITWCILMTLRPQLMFAQLTLSMMAKSVAT